MSRSEHKAAVTPDEVQIPFDRVGKLVRQVSHDLRNHLGSMDLQAAYIVELTTDPELVAELKKLRSMIGGAARAIQGISNNFIVPKVEPMVFSARIVMEDLRDRIVKLFPDQAQRIVWSLNVGDQQVAVDLETIFSALSEIFRNAFSFGAVTEAVHVNASASNNHLNIELREKRPTVDAPTETWGFTPMVSTRRGGYGLGLFRARQLLAANHADLKITHDAGQASLTTLITLPLAS